MSQSFWLQFTLIYVPYFIILQSDYTVYGIKIFCCLMVQSSKQEPFTLVRFPRCPLSEKSQYTTESRGFSPGSLVSSHKKSWLGGYDEFS